jgi:hypothetical protein
MKMPTWCDGRCGSCYLCAVVMCSGGGSGIRLHFFTSAVFISTPLPCGNCHSRLCGSYHTIYRRLPRGCGIYHTLAVSLCRMEVLGAGRLAPEQLTADVVPRCRPSMPSTMLMCSPQRRVLHLPVMPWQYQVRNSDQPQHKPRHNHYGKVVFCRYSIILLRPSTTSIRILQFTFYMRST